MTGGIYDVDGRSLWYDDIVLDLAKDRQDRIVGIGPDDGKILLASGVYLRPDRVRLLRSSNAEAESR